MKNNISGFTLAELLGVIVIISLISMVVFPIVEQNIKDGKERSYAEIINNIENSGYYYSLEHDLGYSEKYKTISLSELKEAGVLKYGDKVINPIDDSELTGCVAYRWYDNKYQFRYIEPCSVDLNVTIKNKTGIFNDYGWANESFWIDIDSSGNSFKYCVGTNECTPNVNINSPSGSVFLIAEGNNYVCANATSELGISETICEQFKLDKTIPSLAKYDIYYDDNDQEIVSLLNVVSGKSGYTINCDKKGVNDLKDVVSTVSCFIEGKNGKSSVANVNFYANYLKEANIADSLYLNNLKNKSEIESITFLDNTTMPADGISKTDISKYKNNSVVSWYMDEDKNGSYELYIGQNGGVIIKDASYLFSNFTKLNSIDLSNINIDRLIASEDMFIDTVSTLTIKVKDEKMKNWIENKLRESGKTATIILE